MTHTCPINGCEHSVGDGQLLCLHHWRLVPPELQREVWATWRAAVRTSRATIFARRRAAYQRARQAAIDAVNRALEACA